MMELARLVAEAQIDLRRVRLARHSLLSDKSNDPYYQSHEAARQNVRLLSVLLSKKARDIPVGAVEPFLIWMPKGPEKDALILLQESRALSCVDLFKRYRFLLHLVPDGMYGFWPAKQIGIQILTDKHFFYRLNKIADNLFAF